MRITGYILLSIAAALYAGIVLGGAYMQSQDATHYANGYCIALGGVRVTDEVCNVNGQIVEVK